MGRPLKCLPGIFAFKLHSQNNPQIKRLSSSLIVWFFLIALLEIIDLNTVQCNFGNFALTIA